MNAKNCVEIVADLKYIGKIFSIRYGLNTDNITRPKDNNKALAKSEMKMVSDYKVLSTT